ncbi:MAG: glutathione peroxidase [Saprospiraceae bacterium]|nr:glutathione peroxidase [Saprospiraceae bacterium]
MRIGILLITLSLPAWFWSCFNGNKVASAPKETISATNQEKPSFYDLKAMSLDGESIDMSKYKGKKIIVLNVASKCGYTPQYADWQKFYESNKDQVEVLGFPCNQFLGQEPGSSDEIATFCQKNYGVTFQMFDKVDVKGDQQHAIYQWLTDPSKNGWNSEVPSWNFCKYLINEEGKLTHFFGSKIKPDNQEFIATYK